MAEEMGLYFFCNTMVGHVILRFEVLLFLYHKSDFLACLIVVSVSCIVFSNRCLFWTLRQLNIYMNLCPQNFSDSAQHTQGVAFVRC